MGLILIVEDEDSVREILISLLANEHLCHTAGTVEQALIYLEIETYDLVLTDISMPGLSGVESRTVKQTKKRQMCRCRRGLLFSLDSLYRRNSAARAHSLQLSRSKD